MASVNKLAWDHISWTDLMTLISHIPKLEGIHTWSIWEAQILLCADLLDIRCLIVSQGFYPNVPASDFERMQKIARACLTFSISKAILAKLAKAGYTHLSSAKDTYRFLRRVSEPTRCESLQAASDIINSGVVASGGLPRFIAKTRELWDMVEPDIVSDLQGNLDFRCSSSVYEALSKFYIENDVKDERLDNLFDLYEPSMERMIMFIDSISESREDLH